MHLIVPELVTWQQTEKKKKHKRVEFSLILANKNQEHLKISILDSAPFR